MALRSHGGSDGPQRLSLDPRRSPFSDRLLLRLMRDELAVVVGPETEGNLPAEIRAARLLVGLHLPDALADTVTLGLGEGGGDRQNSFDRPLPAMSPPRSRRWSLTPYLKRLDNLERVEQAIELGCDDDIATPQLGEQRPPTGRSSTGIEPLTPSSTRTPASVSPCMRA
jgi:hypothetical protein